MSIKCIVWIPMITIASYSCDNESLDPPTAATTPIITPVEITRTDPLTYTTDAVDTFTFVSGGVDTEGLIYLPEAYKTNSDLPAIYLLDYQEQHFDVATDEFAQVIKAVREMPNFDALVVTLKALPDIESVPEEFQKYIDVYKNMTSYVDNNYTNNTSRTIIARGSESGVVLLMLLNEDPEANVFENYIATDPPSSFNSVVMDFIQSGNISENMLQKKLHFSFSSSNNRESCNALIDSFQEAKYPWLSFKSIEFTSHIFTNAYPLAFNDGLNFVFE